MMDSILETIKKILGLTRAYDSFDEDIIVHINSVFSNLTQMGIGPAEGFSISGYEEEWDAFATSDKLKTQQIKSYIGLKVRLMFDPPANANITKSMNELLSEMEYRLYVEEDVLEEEVSDE